MQIAWNDARRVWISFFWWQMVLFIICIPKMQRRNRGSLALFVYMPYVCLIQAFSSCSLYMDGCIRCGEKSTFFCPQLFAALFVYLIVTLKINGNWSVNVRNLYWMKLSNTRNTAIREGDILRERGWHLNSWFDISAEARA